MSQEEERRSMLERKRNILMLIAQYLTDTGLVNAAEILGKECGLLAAASREYSLCDNVDLESIYLDYMSYHQLKFGRPPRIAKRSDSAAGGGGPHDPAAKKPSTAATAGRRRQQQQLQRSSVLRAEMDSANEKLLARDSCLGDTLQVSPCLGQAAAAGDQQQQQQPTACLAAVPLLRMHPNFAPEWAAMAETICRDIVDGAALNVSWQSLKGHRTAKDKLVESVLTPLQYPHLFADPTSVGPLRLRPWKCILLHGPPGTGKTSLARALCRETAGRATFFNVSASTMVSKWRGESEKLVRVLFDVAKYYAPSIVFVDEVEGLMSRRDSSADHEASKRFKNELLTHIDGLDEMHNVFVLGSTNLPWELDPAFLRRFERKLLLGLPDAGERREIIGELMAHSVHWPEALWHELIELSTDFSGDDIRIAHKEAAMRMVRRTIDACRESSKPVATLPDISGIEFRDAVGRIKPASKALLPKYEQWDREHGGG